MLGFFFFLTASELVSGDDPYKILGVPRSALKSEIKSAYRKLTMKYHPDVNKEKGAEQKWIKVNEAYEVLSDPDRKARYDKFGSFDQFDIDSTKDDTPKTFFTADSLDLSKYKFINVTKENFENFTDGIGDYMILVYSSVLCTDCPMYIYNFARFKTLHDKIIRCGVLDTSINAAFAKELGAKRMPSFIYIRKLKNSTKFDFLETKVEKESHIVDFWKKQYPVHIKYLRNDQQLKQFLKEDELTPHVVQHVRAGSPTILYMKTAFVFGDTFRFAVFVNDSYKATRHYNITLYPEILVYRNKDLLPIHLRQMDKAPIQLAEYTQPVLFPIDGFTIPRFCRKFCYVRCGFPSKFEAQKLIDTNFTLGFVEVNSDFANATQMKEGDWVGFLPEHGVFVKLNQRLDDKSTLKYFEEDSKAKKVTPERLPPEFKFVITTDAFAREFNRWWLHVKEIIAPATPYLLVTVLILALNIIYGRVKKANATNKANAMMAAKKRD